MVSSSSPTTFAGIHPHLIHTHILPRLDGPSLATAAATSSYLHSLCADQHLWSRICNSTCPSITRPRVTHVISTFPAGHRSFFQDAFPVVSTDLNRRVSSTHPGPPSELISAVDIRYQDDIVYSKAEFTDTTSDFLSSPFRIQLNDERTTNPAGISQSIDVKVGEVLCADDEIISHLKESVTLNWILIDPTLKRAGNLSGIKPVLAWITNDIHLRYVKVLPGCDPNEMVECRIEVRLVLGKGGVGLQVREVVLYTQDIACNCLIGKEFLVITKRAVLEKNNISVNKEMSTDKMESVKNKLKNRVWADLDSIMRLVSFLLCLYFMKL